MKYIVSNKSNIQKIIKANSELEAKCKYQYLINSSGFFNNGCRVDDDVTIIGIIEKNPMLDGCYDINEITESENDMKSYIESFGINMTNLEKEIMSRNMTMEDAIKKIMLYAFSEIIPTNESNKNVDSDIVKCFICGLATENNHVIPFKPGTVSIFLGDNENDAKIDYYNTNCNHMECAGVSAIRAFIPKKSISPLVSFIRILSIKDDDGIRRNHVAFSASFSKREMIERYKEYLRTSQIAYHNEPIIISSILPDFYYMK